MRHNRLPRGRRTADVIKGYLPESDWNKGASANDPDHEKRIAEYRRRYLQGRDIFTGRKLERPSKLDLVDDPCAPPIIAHQLTCF